MSPKNYHQILSNIAIYCLVGTNLYSISQKEHFFILLFETKLDQLTVQLQKFII